MYNEERVKLFVYGTLKMGYPNNPLITERGGEYIGDVVATGVSMYDLGPFPAAVIDDDGHIHGELWLIDTPTLERTDWLEGYNEREESTSLYLRRRVDTTGGRAYTYIYNDDVLKIFENQKPIAVWPVRED